MRISSILKIRRATPGAASDSSASDETGTAFLEFVIILPFLATILVGLFDISFAIKEYFFLTDAISSGASKAMITPELNSLQMQFSGTHTNCTDRNDGNDESSQGIHQRVASLIQLQNRSLTSLCIKSQREQGDSPSEADIVFVQAYAHYDGMLPLFRGMTITAQTRVPYLLN